MNRKHMFIGAIVTTLVFTVFKFSVLAQDSMSSGSTPVSYSMSSSSSQGLNNVQTQTFVGRVIKITNSIYTIQSNSETKDFKIDNSSQLNITRNSLQAKLSDLQVNDQLTIQYDTNNNILKIDSVDGNLLDNGKIVVIALIAILLLIILLAAFLRSRNKAHIKTITQI